MLVAIIYLATRHAEVNQVMTFNLLQLYELHLPPGAANAGLRRLCACPSRSKFRCFHFTPGCPTPMSKRRRQVR